MKGETSGFPSQTHPFPESLCVTPKWRVLPLIIAPAFVLRCNTGSITSGTLTSHLAYCSTSVHPRDFCRFGFCSYRAKVHSHAVLRARTLAVLASARDQTVIGSLCLQTTACSLRTQTCRKTSNRLQSAVTTLNGLQRNCLHSITTAGQIRSGEDLSRREGERGKLPPGAASRVHDPRSHLSP